MGAQKAMPNAEELTAHGTRCTENIKNGWATFLYDVCVVHSTGVSNAPPSALGGTPAQKRNVGAFPLRFQIQQLVRNKFCGAFTNRAKAQRGGIATPSLCRRHLTHTHAHPRYPQSRPRKWLSGSSARTHTRTHARTHTHCPSCRSSFPSSSSTRVAIGGFSLICDFSSHLYFSPLRLPPSRRRFKAQGHIPQALDWGRFPHRRSCYTCTQAGLPLS